MYAKKTELYGIQGTIYSLEMYCIGSCTIIFFSALHFYYAEFLNDENYPV